MGGTCEPFRPGGVWSRRESNPGPQTFSRTISHVRLADIRAVGRSWEPVVIVGRHLHHPAIYERVRHRDRHGKSRCTGVSHVTPSVSRDRRLRPRGAERRRCRWRTTVARLVVADRAPPARRLLPPVHVENRYGPVERQPYSVASVLSITRVARSARAGAVGP